jgi:hypothetical protein
LGRGAAHNEGASAFVAGRKPIVVSKIENVFADVIHQLQRLTVVVEIARKDTGNLRVESLAVAQLKGGLIGHDQSACAGRERVACGKGETNAGIKMRAAKIKWRHAHVQQLDVFEIAFDDAGQRRCFRSRRRHRRVIQFRDAELVLHRGRRGRPCHRFDHRARGIAQLDRFTARAELPLEWSLDESELATPGHGGALPKNKWIFRDEQIADVLHRATAGWNDRAGFKRPLDGTGDGPAGDVDRV